jgi:TrmH family RNA methyltransferase
LAEGEDLVDEALAAGIRPVESFVAEERAPDSALVDRLARGGPVHVVADGLMAELGTLGHPARVIGVFRREDLPARDGAADLGVYLHRVIDPGNVGTIVRAAGALGPGFVALSAGCSDPLSGKGVRASMGAVFRVPIEASVDNAPEGLSRVALTADGGDALWDIDLTGPVLLLVGAERLGLPEELIATADHVARIPQADGAESLNAAAAATVALYETVRQRATHTESADAADSGLRSNQP